MSRNEKIIIAVLVIIAVLLAVFFLVSKSTAPGGGSYSAQKEPMQYIAGATVSKIDSNSLVLSNGWTLQLASGTRIVTRTNRDPKQYEADIIAYQDAQAQGDATGTPPTSYMEKPLAISDIKAGYGVSVFLTSQMSTGTVPADKIYAMVIFPHEPPPISFKPVTVDTIIKSIQGTSIFAVGGREFVANSFTPVNKVVYKDSANPKAGYNEVRASFADLKPGMHIVFTIVGPLTQKVDPSQISSVAFVPQ